MDKKTNLTPIYRYAEDFAQAVCQNFFRRKEQIDGQEVLKLTRVKQIDLMVVQELFDAWQKEARTIQSPYFDYKVPEVQGAFQKLMNLLSKNISIDRKNFQPLLQTATTNALLLLLYPTSYYERLFATLLNQVRFGKHFAPHFKYIRLHPSLTKLIIQRLQSEKSEVSAERALSAIGQIIDENRGLLEKPHPMLNACGDVLPVGLYELAPDYEEALFEDGPEPEDSDSFFQQFQLGGHADEAEEPPYVDERPMRQAPPSERPNIRRHDFEQDFQGPEFEEQERNFNYRPDTEKKPTIERVPSSEKHNSGHDIPSEKPEQQQSEEIKQEAQPTKQQVQPENVPPIHVQETMSRAEKLAQQLGKQNEKGNEEARRIKLAKLSGGDNQQKGLKGSVKTSEKLLFVSELFGGNRADFEKAIEMIDYSPDYHSALENIKRMYMSKYNWNVNGDTTAKFIAMIDEAKG